jgi:N-acetylglucosaminyl-diphospho-decaprenol L-rhamnosyltransferase
MTAVPARQSAHSDGLPIVTGDPARASYVDCAVVIVTYNSARHVTRLLDSLPVASAGLSTRCIAVDNGSADGTAALLRGRNDITVVETGANLGYAGAINVGRRAAGRYGALLILNPDVVLGPAAITRLCEALAQPGVGVAVPQLRSEDGSLYLSLRREPSPLRTLGEAVLGARLPGRPGWLSETIRDPRLYRSEQDVAWAGGAAMLISAECAAAVGDWDSERFFLYAEETDFAARARAAGFRVRYVPDSQVRHEGGGSSQSAGLVALIGVNRIRYYEKYHRRPATSFFRAAVVLGYLLRSARPAHRSALAAVLSRARWHDLPGATGRPSR